MEQQQIPIPNPKPVREDNFGKVRKAMEERRKLFGNIDLTSIARDAEEFLKVFKQIPGE